MPARFRVALLFVMALLIAGLLAGFARMGLASITVVNAFPLVHAPLMIGAFFGTVISAERAVALSRPWAWAAPLASAASGVILLVSWPWWLAQLVAVAAALVFMAVNLVIVGLQPAMHTMALLMAAACWLIANLVWTASHDVSLAVPWWLAFVIITIAGERLELSRLIARPGYANGLFVAACAVLAAGACLLVLSVSLGLRIFSAGCLALALWLMAYDIARHNITQSGITRYIAACLFSGYVWLAVGSALGILGALLPGHAWRDAALHAITLGFVVAMVFGHALIIVPAVLRIRIAFHMAFYLPLALLHGSLMMRIVATLMGQTDLVHAAAMANAASLAVFVLLLLMYRQSAPKAALRST